MPPGGDGTMQRSAAPGAQAVQTRGLSQSVTPSLTWPSEGLRRGVWWCPAGPPVPRPATRGICHRCVVWQAPSPAAPAALGRTPPPLRCPSPPPPPHPPQAADAERDRSKVEGFHSVLENVRANEDYLMKRVQEFQTEFKIVEGNLNEKAALALQSAEGLRAWQDDVAAQMV